MKDEDDPPTPRLRRDRRNGFGAFCPMLRGLARLESLEMPNRWGEYYLVANETAALAGSRSGTTAERFCGAVRVAMSKSTIARRQRKRSKILAALSRVGVDFWGHG